DRPAGDQPLRRRRARARHLGRHRAPLPRQPQPGLNRAQPCVAARESLLLHVLGDRRTFPATCDQQVACFHCPTAGMGCPMQPKSLRLAIVCALAAVALPSAGLLAAGPPRVAPVQLADAALAQSFVGKTLTGSWTSADHPEWGAAASTVRI